MLGGGGIGEHEASAVTGGGGIEEQVTAVFGGGGTDEQDASAMAGGGGIREHEASAVSGGGGIAEHVASAVTGAGGIGEHEASAVTGGGGIEEQPCAVLGGGGISDPERAGRRARADAASLAPDSIYIPIVQLTARPVTAPAARNHRPRTPGPSRLAPRYARLPALLRTGSPAQSIPVRSSALLADAPVVRPGGTAGASRTGRGRGHRQSRQPIAGSVRWRERDKPRKHPAICQVTSSRPPKPAALPPTWLQLTVTAWRLSGTRYPPDLRGGPGPEIIPQGIPIWTMCVTTGPHGGAASRGQGGAGSPARVLGCRRTVMSPLRGASSAGLRSVTGASRYGPFGRVGGSSEFEPTGFTARRLFWPARPGWSRPRWLGVAVGVLTPLQGPGQAEVGE